MQKVEIYLVELEFVYRSENVIYFTMFVDFHRLILFINHSEVGVIGTNLAN